MVDTKVEFLVTSSNCHFSVGMRIISSTWFEHNVAVVLESSNWPQILQAILRKHMADNVVFYHIKIMSENNFAETTL